VKSATRTLRIFEYLQTAHAPARAIDIGTALGLPKSSANVLLKTLVETGYLIFNEKTRTYLPSFRLVRLSDTVSETHFRERRILNLIHELQARTGECVALTVQNDLHMQCVAMLAEPGLKMAFDEGLKTPVVSSAAGGALMATLPDHELIELARRTFRRQPASGRRLACEDVLDAVRSFRKKGYSVGIEANLLNSRTVAMALPFYRGDVPLILGVGGPKGGVFGHEDEVAALMRRLAEEHLRVGGP